MPQALAKPLLLVPAMDSLPSNEGIWREGHLQSLGCAYSPALLLESSVLNMQPEPRAN